MFDKLHSMERLNEEIKALEKANNWPGIVNLLKPLCVEGGELWNDPAAISSLGFAYTQLKKLPEAEALYRRWIEIEPDRAQPFYSLGYVFYQRQQWEEAIHWFEQALRLHPNYLVCLYRLAYAYYQFRKAKKAKNALIRARQVYESSVDERFLKRNRKTYIRVLFLLGKVLLALKEYQKAYSLFCSVLELDDRRYIDREHKLYELAKAQTHLGEYSAALKSLEQALHPRFPQPYMLDLQGRIYHRMGEYQKALASYNRALRFRQFDYILMDRAQTHLAMGKVNRAVDDLHWALKRSRKSKHKILLELGKIELERNHLSEAGHYFRTAIQQKLQQYGSDYAEAHYLLVFYHLKNGEREKAREELQTALELNPHLEWDRKLTHLLHTRVNSEEETVPF